MTNLPLLLTEVTFLGASSYGILPQGANGLCKTVEEASSFGIPQQGPSGSSVPVDEGDIHMQPLM